MNTILIGVIVFIYLFTVIVAMGVVDSIEHCNGDLDAGQVLCCCVWPLVVSVILVFKIMDIPLAIGKKIGETLERKGWL